jgi:hypothetical protein
MGDITRLFSGDELNRLSPEQKGELIAELQRQLDAAPELKAIINQHKAADQTLLERMGPVLRRLGLR